MNKVKIYSNYLTAYQYEAASQYQNVCFEIAHELAK